MKYLYILLSLVILCKSADITTCKCTQLTTEYDCSNAVQAQLMNQDVFDLKACFWSQGQCLDQFDFKTEISCSSLTETECGNVMFCAWYNSACVSFTKCSDFTFDKQSLSDSCNSIACFDNGTTCAYDLIGRTEQNCEEITSQAVCEVIYILYKSTLCTWNGTSCSSKQLTTCTGLPKAQCNQADAQCGWYENSCQRKVCADGQTKAYQLEGMKICSSFIDLDTNEVVYCNLNSDGICEQESPGDFDRRNCYAQSFQQYKWNQSSQQCEQC